MALKGNLRDFPITQLLNLINLARKTGTLVVDAQVDSAILFFRDGKLGYAHFGKVDVSLTEVLLGNKKITKNQARIIKERSPNINDKELGLLLINGGHLSQQDVISSLQIYYLSILRKLFTWVEGQFFFTVNTTPPAGKISVKIELENIIIEGARIVREWQQLQDEIPSLAMALKFTDRPGANLKNVQLSVEEWKVISYVNPKNSMEQIASASRLNEIEIRKIVYGLLQAGLVEIIRPTTGVMAEKTKPVTPEKKVEQVSLISRLISRIRSI